MAINRYYKSRCPGNILKMQATSVKKRPATFQFIAFQAQNKGSE